MITHVNKVNCIKLTNKSKLSQTKLHNTFATVGSKYMGWNAASTRCTIYSFKTANYCGGGERIGYRIAVQHP